MCKMGAFEQNNHEPPTVKNAIKNAQTERVVSQNRNKPLFDRAVPTTAKQQHSLWDKGLKLPWE